MHSLETSANFSAVIPAAGQGLRMGSVDKLLVPLAGKPVIAWALEVFQKSPHVGDIILVTSSARYEPLREIIKTYRINKTREIVIGGSSRKDSVYNGLQCVRTEFVAIHDGARPLLTPALLKRLIQGIAGYDGCVPGIPAVDTLKEVDSDGMVTGTPCRDRLCRVQTPQVFPTRILKSAYHYAMEKGITATDDASLVEAMGGRVRVMEGDPDNIKITTPRDMEIAAVHLREMMGPGGTRVQ